MLDLHIASGDGTPIYLQIANQVRYLVASGRLAPGEELPPIRVLAQQLLINPNTVARAYRELEVEGVVNKRRTAGTFVSQKGSSLPASPFPAHPEIVPSQVLCSDFGHGSKSVGLGRQFRPYGCA